MGRTKIHVTPRDQGDWAVKRANSDRASKVFEKKTDAIDYAKEKAKEEEKSQVIIHGKDKKIQTEHTYGKDPEKYKG